MILKEVKLRTIFLFIILLCGVLHCSPKEKGISDPKWRDESQKIASDICRKLQDCSKELVQKLKPSLKSYTLSNLRPENCAEKNKKSRIYLLKGYDPELIKSNVRKCHTTLAGITCQDIANGALQKTKTCVIMKKMQLGEKL
ncbi:MAG: hypothetical protein H7A23_04915 [Leptospiraceae bacterium]|nr:hypothetical protein [Leptospiraceae bacterium]MCP5493877.1 hypothetical protein [Leptospiraceae bacterium]